MWRCAFVIILTAHFTNGLTRQELRSQKSWLANPPVDSKEKLDYFSGQLMEDVGHFKRTLDQFLRVRTPGSQGNAFVRRVLNCKMARRVFTMNELMLFFCR